MILFFVFGVKQFHCELSKCGFIFIYIKTCVSFVLNSFLMFLIILNIDLIVCNWKFYCQKLLRVLSFLLFLMALIRAKVEPVLRC